MNPCFFLIRWWTRGKWPSWRLGRLMPWSTRGWLIPSCTTTNLLSWWRRCVTRATVVVSEVRARSMTWIINSWFEACILFFVWRKYHEQWKLKRAQQGTLPYWHHLVGLSFIVCVLFVYGALCLAHFVYITAASPAWFGHHRGVYSAKSHDYLLRRKRRSIKRGCVVPVRTTLPLVSFGGCLCGNGGSWLN